MTEDLDWLLGTYYIYHYDDRDGQIIEYQGTYKKDDKGDIYVYWEFEDYTYTGKVVVAGGNINIFSERDNEKEFVLCIMPRPNTDHLNLLWGVSVGTSMRGNYPASFRVLTSRKKLCSEEITQEFEEAGVTPENGITVLDYDAEKKNKRTNDLGYKNGKMVAHPVYKKMLEENPDPELDLTWDE